MKKSLLRLFLFAFLLALLVGTLVSLAGWLFGWNTPTLFSNGLFISGGVFFVFGILSVACGYNMRGNYKMNYAQSAGDVNLEGRARRLAADMRQEYHASIFLSLTVFS